MQFQESPKCGLMGCLSRGVKGTNKKITIAPTRQSKYTSQQSSNVFHESSSVTCCGVRLYFITHLGSISVALKHQKYRQYHPGKKEEVKIQSEGEALKLLVSNVIICIIISAQAEVGKRKRLRDYEISFHTEASRVKKHLISVFGGYIDLVAYLFGNLSHLYPSILHDYKSYFPNRDTGY